MDDVFDFNTQEDPMKELSPHTYYKPFISTFDREFLLYKFEKKPNGARRIDFDSSSSLQPYSNHSWNLNNSLAEPNSPCTSEESNNTGSELSIHSKPFFPEYYIELSQSDSIGITSSSPLSMNSNNYPFVGEREQSDLHDSSFYNTSRVSPIENHNASLDMSPPPQYNNSQLYSSRLGANYSPEKFTNLRQRSISFEEESETSQNSDNVSVASSQEKDFIRVSSRKRRDRKENTGHRPFMNCNFCKNNKEVPEIYLNHYLYDPDTKVLACPVLRKHVCEICGQTGDFGHTLQYCPLNRERRLIPGRVAVLLKSRTVTNSTGRVRRT